MGKMKDAFTFYGTSGEHDEEMRLDRRDWSPVYRQTKTIANPKPPSKGYISVFDLNCMIGNQGYWHVYFFDANHQVTEMETAAYIQTKDGESKVLSFDGEWFFVEHLTA